MRPGITSETGAMAGGKARTLGVACPSCEGTGKPPKDSAWPRCPTCGGHGSITDKERIERMVANAKKEIPAMEALIERHKKFLAEAEPFLDRTD
jgi:DnaJ-class molecular chaperone